MNAFKIATIVALTSLLGACSTMDRLSQVGQAPPLTAIQDPTTTAGYQPVSMPMPQAIEDTYLPNSLYRTSAKGFFKDQRAHRVGDILTVLVTIDDQAQISNQTARGRTSTNTAGVGGVLGSIFNGIAPDVDAKAAVDTTSGMNDKGTGSVNRKENIETSVAAVVTQVLPNGNLVIEGRQEVRVNFEVRDLIVSGIVRPEDIRADNTIPSTKIAEARVAYGGRGQITDVQQPRYGQQVLDAILPF
ncbi:flagellar basal body L-ring protein FlgH [Paradevosia shaoguanensis]|uniref:Flagellar L-ring protein n=1 Tax=Paradevosia shaoguanensis TaxID=1335043 RepID=A0AA41QNZ5_9HYPH|nr:flagellar basal body L-ring protein FlgH [Paradevosia shaoguanensis]KFL28757.1 flagellar L-ring protein FlgH [Devosia sp. 17-2-E-8]MBI4048096.1 flagellar basal body L-ring protein FlgH [Devosia nanyangense]QMV01478.1 flagellar basal body L-ring protein FlgH [Devosia sp. D6-9]CDP50378.1 Flagellar L-ring protein FlgH [Devosia sp. DBB001]MCF1743185.1 flagellar basal body L-ring protein FlgH [Paradevosia shaoguanensis]